MKVLCINAENNYASKHKCDLVEGETYTVIKEVIVKNIYGKLSLGYKLLERLNAKGSYNKSRFIPVSDIDETEVVRELQLNRPNYK